MGEAGPSLFQTRPNSPPVALVHESTHPPTLSFDPVKPEGGRVLKTQWTRGKTT